MELIKRHKSNLLLSVLSHQLGCHFFQVLVLIINFQNADDSRGDAWPDSSPTGKDFRIQYRRIWFSCSKHPLSSIQSPRQLTESAQQASLVSPLLLPLPGFDSNLEFFTCLDTGSLEISKFYLEESIIRFRDPSLSTLVREDQRVDTSAEAPLPSLLWNQQLGNREGVDSEREPRIEKSPEA